MVTIHFFTFIPNQLLSPNSFSNPEWNFPAPQAAVGQPHLEAKDGPASISRTFWSVGLGLINNVNQGLASLVPPPKRGRPPHPAVVGGPAASYSGAAARPHPTANDPSIFYLSPGIAVLLNPDNYTSFWWPFFMLLNLLRKCVDLVDLRIVQLFTLCLWSRKLRLSAMVI